ncbi:hypothetical protein [Halorientalis salina]|uniref:hypothetical protein n=1 Tax=Halorientalis salina TaxID=2932266 RepID=UPI0010AD7F53|nr:hypothetical protein [Halorientalis salina]
MFESLRTDSSPVRWFTHGVQALLVGLVAYSLVSFQFGELVNMGIPLALAFVPTGLRLAGYRVNPVVGLWIVSAALLHVLGSFGLYTMLPWFDQLAHAVSASLVAGVGFAAIQSIDRYHPVIEIPPRLRFVFLFVFATAFGVLWELSEFAIGLLASVLGGEPLLAQYGLSDVVLDLLFNSVGALVVAALGTEYFENLTRVFGREFDFGADDQ